MKKGPFLALCLMLAHSSPGFADVGFLSVSDPSIPPAVRESAKSVYFLSGLTSSFEGAKLQVKLNDGAYLNSIQAPEKFWQKLQFDACSISGAKVCTIFDRQLKGTAFVFKSQNTVATNFHNVREQVSTEYRLSPASESHELRLRRIAKMPVTIGLVAPDEEPLLHSSEATLRLDFATGNKSMMVAGELLENAVELRLLDYVEIVAPTRLGIPLKPAKKAPKIGDTLYLVGYPRKTTDRAEFGKQDSNGNSQYIAVGKQISMQNFEANSGQHLDPLRRRDYTEHLLFTSMDCEAGFSGGPILNAEGEVVAILSTRYNEPGKRVCAGLKTFDHNQLQALWNRQN